MAKPVIKISKTGEVVHTYASVKEAAFRNGVTISAIYNSIKGVHACADHYWSYDVPPKLTERNFAYHEFIDQKGVVCSIQKSSLAMVECIWLGCDDPGVKMLYPGKGWLPVELQTVLGTDQFIVNTRMHLTRKMVAQLLPILQKFVQTGDL